MYMYIFLFEYSSICCIVQLTYHAIGACTSRHCPLSTRLSSMPSSSSSSFQTVRYGRQCTRDNRVLLKQYASTSTSSAVKIENCEFSFRSIKTKHSGNETRFRNFREIREIRIFEYSSWFISIARFEFQRYRKVWGHRVGNEGTRTRSKSDAGQSVRGKIFKVNSGRDCVFQNSYLNPFFRRGNVKHSFKAPTFILTSFVSLKNSHTHMVLLRVTRTHFQFFSSLELLFSNLCTLAKSLFSFSISISRMTPAVLLLDPPDLPIVSSVL